MGTAILTPRRLGLLLLLAGCSNESTDSAAHPGGQAGEDGGPGATGSKPPCLTKPSQVVALGDSYVAAPVVLIPKVVQLAVTDGALMQGETYRDYSAPGTTLGSPQAPGSIPPQWTAAKQADPDIEGVIMDGGGNDIIGSITCLAAGSSTNQTCINIVQGVMATVSNMAMDMKATGVKDVVYFLYPHVPLGGADIEDYSIEQTKPLLASLTTDSFRMHFVDTRAAFEGHPEYFGADPIHANPTGAQVIAGLVWQTMKDNCIAQPASSGCCAP